MYGDVILTRDVAEHGLRTGDVGTVVERQRVNAPQPALELVPTRENALHMRRMPAVAGARNPPRRRHHVVIDS